MIKTPGETTITLYLAAHYQQRKEEQGEHDQLLGVGVGVN